MVMKENFTAEEWTNLVSLPYAVSMAVIAADAISLSTAGVVPASPSATGVLVEHGKLRG